jgi:hypothetical protein
MINIIITADTRSNRNTTLTTTITITINELLSAFGVFSFFRHVLLAASHIHESILDVSSEVHWEKDLISQHCNTRCISYIKKKLCDKQTTSAHCCSPSSNQKHLSEDKSILHTVSFTGNTQEEDTHSELSPFNHTHPMGISRNF